MSCPMSWLADNSTKLPGLCHVQGSPQERTLAHLDLGKKRQHRTSSLSAEKRLFMGCVGHRHPEDWNVLLFRHQPWERPHFDSHAYALEARDEVDPTVLTLKYRWIKSRENLVCQYIYIYIYMLAPKKKPTFCVADTSTVCSWMPCLPSCLFTYCSTASGKYLQIACRDDLLKTRQQLQAKGTSLLVAKVQTG